MTAITVGTRHVRHTQLRAPRPVDTQTIAPRLRLTRRGRIALTTLAAGPLVALALVTALNGGIAMAGSDVSSGTFSYMTVQAGQSLWELAESIAPAADPREVISDIVHLNQLESSSLQPGDRIAIPAEYSH